MSFSGLNFHTFLNIEDIQEIYKELERKIGTTKAAKKCNIARTTPSRWNNVELIRPETKIKVLQTCIDEIPIKTLDILLERGIDRVEDLFLNYLSFIYNRALEEEDPESFSQMFNLFQELRAKFGNFIVDNTDDQVRDMLQLLLTKSDLLSLYFFRDDISTISSKNLLDILPHLLEDIVTYRPPISELTKKYRIDITIPTIISEAVNNIEQNYLKKVLDRTFPRIHEESKDSQYKGIGHELIIEQGINYTCKELNQSSSITKLLNQINMKKQISDSSSDLMNFM